MVSNSIPVIMTVIDIAIIGIVVFAWSVSRKYRRHLVRANASAGYYLILAGLTLIGTFYLADLLVMLVLPSLVGAADAMAAMDYLHRNFTSLVVLFGLTLIVAGITVVARRFYVATERLEDATSMLVEERQARADAESALAVSRDQLADIVTISLDAIIVADADRRVRAFNQGAETIFGYSASEVMGEPIDLLLPSRFREIHQRHIRDFVASSDIRRRMNERGDVIGVRRDGTEFPAEASITKLRSNGETLLAVILRDISERRTQEANLRHAQKMESVGRLSGGVAHDFNNLLQAILGNLELLRERIAEDKTDEQRLIARAVEAVGRGTEMTKRLLAFSRRQVLEPRVVDLNALVSEITDVLPRMLGEAVGVEVVRAGGLWPCEIDPSELEAALLNLAVNARDAMPEGGKLTIETANARLDDEYAAAHAEVTPGQYVMLAVADTGGGMTPEIAERAFEPFFTTKQAGEGTGLGLSMVYGFVKQSKGHVKIYSEPGHGTTVKLYLPRAFGGESKAEAGVERVRAAQGQLEKILVVEDDPAIRDLTVEQLESMNYLVLHAPDGASALRILAEVRDIDLLFTDVVLPAGMNGAELAREAVRVSPGIGVLYTSGYTDNAIVHHGRLEPGAELIAKPFRKEDLARKLRAILDRDDGTGGAGD
jgi:PAS domain S-box-containing protein